MSRARFPKPVHQYRVLLLFGGNIVASEGDEWKRYRKVAAPAFSEKNNKLVWDETVKIMVDMFHTLWNDAPEVTVDHCIDITLPVSHPIHSSSFKTVILMNVPHYLCDLYRIPDCIVRDRGCRVRSQGLVERRYGCSTWLYYVFQRGSSCRLYWHNCQSHRP